MSKVIETDTKTFVKFWLVPVVIILTFLFLQSAREGLVVIGLSIFLALALRPLVHAVNNFFSRHLGTEKKYRTASVALAYLIVVIVVGGVLAIVGPVVVSETTKFVQQLPVTFEQTLGGWEGVNNFGRTIGIENLQGDIDNSLKNLSRQITGVLGPDIVSSVSGVASVVTKAVLVLILTMLFLLEGPGLVRGVWRRLSASGEKSSTLAVAKRIVSKMTDVVSIYVSRQALIAVIDGTASCLIVFLLSLFTDISSGLAIPMGLITMMLYMIPMFGQFIGGALVTVILLFTNWWAALIFAVVYIVYAQIENNVLSPRIQGEALRLPAVVILCAVVVGMYMAGLLGALIAIPIAGCIKVLIDEYPNIKQASKA